MPVEVTGEFSVLEYQLGASEKKPSMTLLGPEALGSFFTLVATGGFDHRPVMMRVGDQVQPNGRVSYRRRLKMPVDAREATLVVGAATGLTVLLDGEAIARQEHVEYYEDWGATPMYFRHDITTRLTAGDHEMEILADSLDARDIVFVDLVAHHAEGTTSVVSGPGWTTSSGGTSSPSALNRGYSSDLAFAYAAVRSHPLPSVTWLEGEPELGTPVDDVRATDSLTPQRQWFRSTVPAGVTSILLPEGTGTDVTVWVAGEEVPITDGACRLDRGLAEPAELLVRTAPTVVDRSGAWWKGPLKLLTTDAPIQLGQWSAIGLKAWSGGVRYRRTLVVPAGARNIQLDLGCLRGSVEVAVNGHQIGAAFCAPFRFDLGDQQGSLDLEVVVYNTLAPFLDESTPTTWVFPSQLVSGLVGPVTLTYQVRRG
jgi:hypothetical protein